MKKLFKTALIMSLLQLISPPAAAQINLVPNPSFEEYDSCPMFYPDLDGNLKYWTSFRGSPDYMNDCSLVCGYDNQFGYQAPRNGQAYVGFINFDNYLDNATEQVGIKLISPLTIGTTYYLSFYVSCGFTPLLTNIASNKIGATFTTYDYQDPFILNPIPNKCHIFSNIIVKDTTNWVKIAGAFIADSSYNYLIIGGFFDRNNVDTVNLPYSVLPQISYYFLDDVCLSTDPSLCDVQNIGCDFILPTAFSPNGDMINDEYKWVQNCTDIASFRMNIYNRWGEIVFTTRDSYNAWDGRYRGEEQPSDVYAVHVSVVIDGKPISKISNLILFR